MDDSHSAGTSDWPGDLAMCTISTCRKSCERERMLVSGHPTTGQVRDWLRERGAEHAWWWSACAVGSGPDWDGWEEGGGAGVGVGNAYVD